MSALEDDYERLFPAPSSSQKGQEHRNSNNATTTATNNTAGIAMSGNEPVGVSLNSIKVERSQRGVQ